MVLAEPDAPREIPLPKVLLPYILTRRQYMDCILFISIFFFLEKDKRIPCTGNKSKLYQVLFEMRLYTELIPKILNKLYIIYYFFAKLIRKQLYVAHVRQQYDVAILIALNHACNNGGPQV